MHHSINERLLQHCTYITCIIVAFYWFTHGNNCACFLMLFFSIFSDRKLYEYVVMVINEHIGVNKYMRHRRHMKIYLNYCQLVRNTNVWIRHWLKHMNTPLRYLLKLSLFYSFCLDFLVSCSLKHTSMVVAKTNPARYNNI